MSSMETPVPPFHRESAGAPLMSGEIQTGASCPAEGLPQEEAEDAPAPPASRSLLSVVPLVALAGYKAEVDNVEIVCKEARRDEQLRGALVNVRHGPTVASSSNGKTRLMSACRHGHLERCRELIQAKADVNYSFRGVVTGVNFGMGFGQQMNNVSGLHFHPAVLAAEHGHVDVLRELVAAGADTGGSVLDDMLMKATKKGQQAVVQYCAESLGATQTQLSAALGEASSLGHADVARYLVGAGADIEHRVSMQDVASGALDEGQNGGFGWDKSDRMTPLLAALEKKHMRTARALLALGADVTAISEKQRTPLSILAWHISTARLIESFQPDKSQDSSSPEQQDMEALLKELCAMPVVPVELALPQAVSHGWLDLVKALHAGDGRGGGAGGEDGGANLQADGGGAGMGGRGGADLHMETRDGGSLLILAYSKGHKEVVQYLLRAGADNRKVRQSDKVSLLTLAADAGDEDTLRYLLERGADPEGTSEGSGKTLLMRAAEKGSLPALEEIMFRRANVRATWSEKDTPVTALSLACSKGHLPVVRRLCDANALVGAELDVGINALRAAAAKGHADAVKELLLRKVDLQDKVKAALCDAVRGGFADVVRVLCEQAGADPNYRYEGDAPAQGLGWPSYNVVAGWEPGTPLLLMAMDKGHTAVVRTLLSLGADINAKGPSSPSTVWSMCEGRGQVELLKDLCEHEGADPQEVLPHAVRRNWLPLLQKLLDTGADVNAARAYSAIGTSYLIIACDAGHADIARELIKRGANLDVKGLVWTPLTVAVFKRHSEVVRVLLDAGADPNCRTISLQSPLEIALERKDSSTVDMLCRMPTIQPEAALRAAVLTNLPEAVKLAISRGACPTTCIVDHGVDALSWAAEMARGQVVKDMVEGCEPGPKVLLAAVRYGMQDAVGRMVAAGVDVNSTDASGASAVMWASERGDAASVRLLCTHGADVHPMNDAGWTALGLASATGAAQVIQLLCEFGANVNTRLRHGKSALMWACEGGHVHAVGCLLEQRAAINAADVHGYTPLIYAARKGHVEVVQKLLKAGADAAAKTSTGETAASIARASGHDAVHALFLDSGASAVSNK